MLELLIGRFAPDGWLILQEVYGRMQPNVSAVAADQRHDVQGPGDASPVVAVGNENRQDSLGAIGNAEVESRVHAADWAEWFRPLRFELAEDGVTVRVHID